MRKVIVESPFSGDVERNLTYGRRCMRDCILRGETPYASHLLYTQLGVLDDTIPEERKLGMEAGFAWHSSAQASVVYTDYGMSRGMEEGIRRAKEAGLAIEYRQIGTNP